MSKLVKSVLLTVSAVSLFLIGWFGHDIYKDNKSVENPVVPVWIKPRPMDKYSIESLSQTPIKPSKIIIDNETEESEKYTSNNFYFEFDPTLQNKEVKRVTGLINMPIKSSLSPVVILIRGYVDQTIYETGVGTKRVGEYLANNGYITLAPDFLGYGGSSKESENIFETRFQTYTTVLTLLKSINRTNLPQWDGKNILIWAHSNGGQIALTTLEITGEDYPTVLWAPVTKPFPYSILYYTDESEDEGKFIRKELAKFEEDYDTDKYSITNYLDRINAPIEYHIGTRDDAIPLEWGTSFIKKMESLEKTVRYYNHSGADHNMNPLWSDVIQKTLEFFNDSLEV